VKRKTLGLPVRVTNWSDSSQIVTLFTPDLGIVEAVAKGAHRIPNPFQGPFDLAVLWEVVFAERPPERGLSILTEGVVVEGFPGARRSFRRWAAAAFIVEYLRAVGTAGEASGELFEAAIDALRAVSDEGIDGDDIGGGVLEFEGRALRILGLAGPVSACAACGRPWSGSDRPVFFSIHAGGILCGACRKDRSGIQVGGAAVRALGAWVEGGRWGKGREPIPSAPPGGPPVASSADRPEPAGPPRLDPAVRGDLARIIAEYRVFSLERNFRLLQYFSF
jgi:DNA repair protein RecO (recombination protein O)